MYGPRMSYSVQVDSTDVGKHLQACEDMLQRHALHEADITVTRVGGTQWRQLIDGQATREHCM